MEILSKRITQVILVHFNEIPLLKLANKQKMDLFIRKFKFDAFEGLKDQENKIIAINYRNGLFGYWDVEWEWEEEGEENEDDKEEERDEEVGREYFIDKLLIEERKIQFEIDGPSQVGDAYFNKLKKFLADLSGTTNDTYLTPIVKAEESIIVARLNIKFKKLISPMLLQFMTDVVTNEARSEIADAIVRPASLKFNINYLPKDNFLNDSRISLSRKDFTISPEKGYLLDDRIYYSKAPFDTDTHIKLLQELEGLFMEED